MDYIHHFIAHWGYLGMFFIIFVDNMNLPFPPTEIVLTLIGWFISHGMFDIWIAFIITTIAGVLGCVAFYYIIRYAGDYVLPKMQKWLRISDDKIQKSNDYFHKYGGWALFIGRVTPGLRTVSLIPAAIFCYPMRKFLFYITLGTAVWNGAFLFFGHIFYHNFQ